MPAPILINPKRRFIQIKYFFRVMSEKYDWKHLKLHLKTSIELLKNNNVLIVCFFVFTDVNMFLSCRTRRKVSRGGFRGNRIVSSDEDQKRQRHFSKHQVRILTLWFVFRFIITLKHFTQYELQSVTNIMMDR